jgi:release factor glutamine methyltransferase
MEENPKNTLSALWHASSGHQISPVLAEKKVLPELTPSQSVILHTLIQERMIGVPLAHLTERQHFLGLEFIVKKGIYIPRKDTELLAKTAIGLISEDCNQEKTITVLDLCSGIGTVALAIANYCKNVHVYGSDIYKPAIACAEVNADHFGLKERASFFNADLFDPFEQLLLKGKTQFIVSAPPYISTSKVKQMAAEISNHEPSEAFDAGAMGFSVFFKLISTATEYLQCGGYLIFECGQGQGEFLAKRVRLNKAYTNVTEIKDENGHVRVISAQKA